MRIENTDNSNVQTDLFALTSKKSEKKGKSTIPLAHRARPKSWNEFKGQRELFRRYPFLQNSNFPSLILWGPPGTGKTTLAHILAENSKKEIYHFNAVLGGVNDLKKLINSAMEMKDRYSMESIIFIDEIHRFNKAQQDALLPYVEKGSFTLIGATTENPRRAVNRALLSRMQMIELKLLSEEEILEILSNAANSFEINAPVEVLEFIADHSGGDARKGLNILDLVEQRAETLTLETIKTIILENCRHYDKNQDRHYDVISAFIKSMRGSDPNAAILWLAVMLDGGEDPVFIARRLVIFASEDVGNADPQALSIATAALTSVQNIGMPEARIALAQATTYLSSTVKSNAAYKAINQALSYVESRPSIEVPNHLKNYPPRENKKKYQYPHDFPGHFVKESYTNEPIPKFYNPEKIGFEKNISTRLEDLWGDQP